MTKDSLKAPIQKARAKATKPKVGSSAEKTAAETEYRRRRRQTEKALDQHTDRSHSTTATNSTMNDDPDHQDSPSEMEFETNEREDSILSDKTLEEQEAADANALLAHINKSRKTHPNSSPNNNDGYNSDETQNQGNGRSRSYAEVATSRRPVNDGLDGYSRTPSKHVLFCKAKILVPESETPAAKTRSTFGMILTTLLKIDASVKIYVYKDDRNRTFINNSTQIPEIPSKMKTYFFGRWRPASKDVTMWPEIKIGFDIEPENFFSDASALLNDKGEEGDYRLYEKELQAAETEIIGFFLFSTDRQDRSRLRKAIRREANKEFNVEPEFVLRWRKISDPSQTKEFKNMGKGQANKTSDKDDIKALHIEVIKGQATIVGPIFSKLYSKTRTNYPDSEKMRFVPSTS